MYVIREVVLGSRQLTLKFPLDLIANEETEENLMEV